MGAVCESAKSVKYLASVATRSNFIEMLNRRPKCLHISCHGIKNSEETIGVNHASLKDEGDFLLLENESFQGEPVSEKALQKIIKGFGVQLDLVFVAACKSQFVGKIFQTVGAQHVICVREGSEVKDEAALVFTRRFYRCIFAGDTIC